MNSQSILCKVSRKNKKAIQSYQYVLFYKFETINQRDEARQKYLQMGQGHQVIERALRNTGNIISMECPRRGRSKKISNHSISSVPCN